MRNSLLFMGLLLLAACTADSTAPVEQAQTRRPAAALITQAEAQYRKQVVANPSYELTVYVDADSPEFSTETTISFDYLGDGAPLNVDFAGGEVLGLSINGEETAFTYNGSFITLPEGSLQPGLQKLHIRTSHPYSQDGAGLYRYTDAVDGKVYLYTDFEAYDANSMFPLFDQPDLKATFKLKVHAPAHWQMVSSVRETGTTADGEVRVWDFPTSALMSSYLISLHGGEYTVFEDKDFRYPLRLFVRQSLAHYVNAPQWFA